MYSFRYKIDADPAGQCAQGYSPQIITSVGNRLLASGQQDTFDALNNQVTSAAVGTWVLFQRRVTGKDSFGYGAGTPMRVQIVNDAPPRCPLLIDEISMKRLA